MLSAENLYLEVNIFDFHCAVDQESEQGVSF